VATTFISRARGMFFAGGEPKAAMPSKPALKPVQKFHAVSVTPGRNCCHSARALKGKRFLSREAPVLPLKNCMNDECTCFYAHHEDRRENPRRARDMGVAIDGWLEIDRRGGAVRGRRKTDKPTS
jgi:hypothetical protein